MEAANLHKSVLLHETVELLGAARGGIFVDCTLGLGGHAEAILQASENASVIGIDQDRDAIRLASERLAPFGERVKIFHANFAEIKTVLTRAGVQKVNGVLADLGVSSLQFDDANRGFSFRFDAPLDMRMDAGSEDETGAELLARLSEVEIADLIYNYGEERMSRRIARRIVWKREIGEPVRTTRELAETVEKAIGRGAKSKDKIHPATRTFQALRIAVNREIEILEEFIADAANSLKTGGRLAMITFHSLEDRVVKQTFQKLAGKCTCPPRLPQCVCGAAKVIEIVTRKPIVPKPSETDENPRARSAKLRVGAKI
ncbi:MAG TPA: 16S rRNA (cytosine(1402)-N(4))-methyltransferase RsmH [Pyrinomonadaceae bacterium]|jgi:16S rRNA (cytosine1402-N4)-methyltransferase